PGEMARAGGAASSTSPAASGESARPGLDPGSTCERSGRPTDKERRETHEHWGYGSHLRGDDTCRKIPTASPGYGAGQSGPRGGRPPSRPAPIIATRERSLL